MILVDKFSYCRPYRGVKKRDASLLPSGHVLIAIGTRPFCHKHVWHFGNPLQRVTEAKEILFNKPRIARIKWIYYPRPFNLRNSYNN